MAYGVTNKMRAIGSALAVLVALLAASPSSANEDKLVHVVRFTDYELGSVEDWLLSKGFQFEQDAQRRNRIDLDVGEKSLVL